IVIAGWIGQPLIMRTSRGGALFSLASVFVGPPSLFCGALVALCGHLGTLWCYSALGDSWRIGVMRDEKTTLVTHGPYRLVRHPIYLFQFMILVGMLVLLPSLFSILILFIHFICVILKSFDEERHLAAIHDCKYHDYLLRTGGFFPRWKSILLVLGIRKKS
ncbi:MAG TPA: isoprenylcysteine carboxylmethyltransferase family protein, partial [Thermodesulfovibrionales bacterium]|nr:isoprenylcysteine carboxylmethyltransferase family protein [Thermodesulfovibrionales bacterium]